MILMRKETMEKSEFLNNYMGNNFLGFFNFVILRTSYLTMYVPSRKCMTPIFGKIGEVHF